MLVKMNKKTIAILAPCYSGDFDTKTKMCLNKSRNNLDKFFNIIDITIKETYIHRGRRLLLQKVLDLHRTKRIDFVLWLDSDVEFEPYDIVKLVQHLEEQKLETLSGIYFSRHGNHNPMYCNGNIEYGFQFHNEVPKEDKIFKVDAVGFGFFLIPISTLIKYTNNYKPTEWFESNKWFPTNTLESQRIYVVGEDLDWCLKAKKIGININVDSSILLSHNGITIYDWERDKKKIVPHCDPIVRYQND